VTLLLAILGLCLVVGEEIAWGVLVLVLALISREMD
jgi:hypothetical protein